MSLRFRPIAFEILPGRSNATCYFGSASLPSCRSLWAKWTLQRVQSLQGNRADINHQLYYFRRISPRRHKGFLIPCSKQASLLARLISVCKQRLALPGSSRDLAARLLARLLSRPDSKSHLLDFVAWASGSLRDDGQALFKTPGQ